MPIKSMAIGLVPFTGLDKLPFQEKTFTEIICSL